MKRLGVVLALLAAIACAGRGDRDLQQAFDAARLALWRGDLPEAYRLSERGVSLS